MIYPEPKDLQMVFDQSKNFANTQEWEEGLAVGFSNSQNDSDLAAQMEYLVSAINNWMLQSKDNEITH